MVRGKFEDVLRPEAYQTHRSTGDRQPQGSKEQLEDDRSLKLNIILIYKFSPKSLYTVLAGGGFEPPISGL